MTRMNKFGCNELEAMRRSALALNQSDYEVTVRLERAYDQISLMLELLHDHSSTESLTKIDNEITNLLDKLVDTQLITRMVIRERELERKLAELDKQLIPDKVSGIKSRILDLFEENGVNVPTDGHQVADAETMQRIEKRLQLESLVDSLYTSEAAERVKKMLKKEGTLIGGSRRVSVGVSLSSDKMRPYNPMQDKVHRELDAQIPTAKGEGYELPDIHPTTDK